jgi:hypothetical protein
VNCLFEDIGELSDRFINVRLCFEFPFAVHLFAYLRFVSVPVGMRVMKSGGRFYGHGCSAEGGYDRGVV